jgi:hypothetical protein
MGHHGEQREQRAQDEEDETGHGTRALHCVSTCTCCEWLA